MTSVHTSATLGDEVELGQDVEIGPNCSIEGPVRLGDGVRLVGNVYLRGPLTVGAGTIIYPFACLGFPAQDIKFKLGDPTPGVSIGTDCIIREHATVHAATHQEHPTTIGDRVFMMVGAHVGHDALVGNDVVLVNNACLAGHTVVSDRVTFSGLTALHQFCRAGRFAFISGGAVASCDVPPFAIISTRNTIGSVNIIGMRRAGLSNSEITSVRRAYREVFKKVIPRKEMEQRLDELARDSALVAELAEFVKTAKRPLCRMARHSQETASDAGEA